MGSLDEVLTLVAYSKSTCFFKIIFKTSHCLSKSFVFGFKVFLGKTAYLAPKLTAYDNLVIV